MEDDYEKVEGGIGAVVCSAYQNGKQQKLRTDSNPNALADNTSAENSETIISVAPYASSEVGFGQQLIDDWFHHSLQQQQQYCYTIAGHLRQKRPSRTINQRSVFDLSTRARTHLQ
jgi:hypothetical protein